MEPGRHPRRVFLNVPFDTAYEPTFIGLVAALVHLGMRPTTVLELGGGDAPHLDRLGYNSGMKRAFDDLLRDALNLPPGARAALAGSLIDSLDGECDDLEAAWDAEIPRRLREIQEGHGDLVPWTEVRRHLIGQ